MLKLPAAKSDRVNVAVTRSPSTSVMTMSIRSSGVSSVYVSAASRLVAVGASSTAVPVMALLPVIVVVPSSTLVAMLKLAL